MQTKPFFSLVIACYNDGKYKEGVYLDRLLQSVCEQGILRKDIEIILADDHSPVPYDDIIAKYKKKRFQIRQVVTDYNFGPGNTRQKGAEAAQGEWLCFADHDDTFYPKALKKVKDVIEETGETRFVCGAFNKVDQDTGEVIEEFRNQATLNWVHAKFYNLENFWRKYNFHFPKDLKTHEDIAVGNQFKCVSTHLGDLEVKYISEPLYKWTYNLESISHKTYYSEEAQQDHPFLEKAFQDYLDSDMGVYFERFQMGQMDRTEFIDACIITCANCWILLGNWKIQNPKTYLKSNDIRFSQMYKKFKELSGLTTAGLKVFTSNTIPGVLEKIRALAEKRGTHDLFAWYDDMDALIEKNPDGILPVEELEISNRPFFSVIIPCYNDGRYKEGNYLDRLLSSLEDQSLDKSDLEVIISDDHSPVAYDEIVNKHKANLNIKTIVTDYNFAPGNTRAKGVTIATGQWLAFADHDDIYYPNALSMVKRSLLKRNEKYYAFSAFNGVTPDGQINRKFEYMMNWCHGKFYNFDNLWKPNNIHFIKDLKSHEDIAICTQVSCALSTMGQTELTYINTPTYAWTDNPESVSHAKYTVSTDDGPREFLEVFFDDYIHATGYIYLEAFKEHRVQFMYAAKRCLEILCYGYFYTQGFQFRRPDDFYRPNLAVMGNYFREVKKTFNLTNEQAYAAISENNAQLYYNVIDMAAQAAGHYIPTQGLKEWIELIDHSYE